MMKNPFGIALWLCCLIVLMPAKAEGDDSGKASFPLVKIEAERLPDLNIGRGSHCTFVAGDEIVVIGGHTKGFTTTATAEYYKDGQWHLLQTDYEHDAGFCTRLSSGKILIGGGFERHLGIGQTYPVETFDPATHAFEGFCVVQQKRAEARALVMDNDLVVVAGNWYNHDAIETFDGKQFTLIKEPTQQRSLPYIFRAAKDDAIIFYSRDTYDNQLDTIIIDRLKGAPYTVALFDTWRPKNIPWPFDCQESFIGDAGKGDYTYLFSVEDASGRIAIAKAHGYDITLLPTYGSIPMKDPWGQDIEYYSPVIADRHLKRAYLVGYQRKETDNSRIYVLRIDYGQADGNDKAPLTLYYTAPLPQHGGTIPVLTAEGNLVLAGGANGKTDNVRANDNFHPYSTVYLLPIGNQTKTGNGYAAYWLWGGILTIIILSIAIIGLRLSRQKRGLKPYDATLAEDERKVISTEFANELTERICQLMENDKPYLQQNFKVTDLATVLNTNTRYIYDSLKAVKGCTFTQFVNSYRIDHAKQLLIGHPSKKISAIALESGFTSDKALSLYFREATGMTPTEWKNNLQNQESTAEC